MEDQIAIGLETEYGISCLGGEAIDPIRLSSDLVREVLTGDIHAVPCESDRHHAIDSFMLGNASRCYVDHAHPEYSTPECLAPHTVVAADKAGELLLLECMRRLDGRPDYEGRRTRLYKNNSDYKGNSYGCHENYLLPASMFIELSRMEALFHEGFLPFLLTRPIMCGAGKVGAENGTAPATYQLTQRADFMETISAPQTTFRRPLFNTRDEPHADRRRFRRLHVIIGDANLAEVSTYLKVGTTQLVLRMLKAGFYPRGLSLADPVAAFHQISRDVAMTQLLRLADGRTMTAVEIQLQYLEQAERFIAGLDDPATAGEVVAEWRSVLECLPHRWLALSERLDWAIKRRLLESYAATNGLEWPLLARWQPVVEAGMKPAGIDKAKQMASALGLGIRDYDRYREAYFGMRRLELDYHDIRRGATTADSGIYNWLAGMGAIDLIADEAEITRYAQSSPTETRSWLRGVAVSRFYHELIAAGWDRLYFGQGGGDIVTLPDPSHPISLEIRTQSLACLQAEEFIALIKEMTA